MQVIKTWEGIRHQGVICISVPEFRWSRTVHEWEIARLRGYLRAARYLPAQTRLEIAAWLEQQEAQVECEISSKFESPTVMAERLAWVSFGVAVVCLIVAAIVIGESIL